ncbi:MAG: tripartite tricarboxylate transporter substrate binding protein [Burkholderiales bacterium]|nr:tripartite tricarboxylate transporter substrate binding protein [Burkholderiales bacterium]
MNIEHHSTRIFVAAVASAAALLAMAAPAALAADYPDRPIRILVPFTPGGSTDILARMIGQKLTEVWGQQVIADNRPGANGVVAADIAAKSNPDGHTLLFVAIGHALNPILQKKLPYDSEKAFVPISLTAVLPMIAAVHPSVKATNVQELLALAKGSKPINYATGGVGSSQHLATGLLSYMTKVKMNHIPYKGGNQGLLDVVAGHVDLIITTALTVIPHAKAGRLRPLAVSTSNRLAVVPELPTIAESGVRGYESVAWYGMVAPAGLPPAVLDKLSAETIRATKSDDMQQALVKQGAIPVGNTPKEFTAFIRNETAKYTKVIQEAGIKAE